MEKTSGIMQTSALNIRAVTTPTSKGTQKYMSKLERRESCRAESVVGLPEKIHVFGTDYVNTLFIAFLKFKISWYTIFLVAKPGNLICGGRTKFLCVFVCCVLFTF